MRAEIARTCKNVLAHIIHMVDLAETMAQQYRRVTREFNVNLDLNASLQTFFTGISNFFHYALQNEFSLLTYMYCMNA